jgi:two-component system, cell cycle response regulator CpdR
MASPIKKRSIFVSRRKTSVSLEQEFWDALKEIAAARRTTMTELIGSINQGRSQGNLSSTLRLFVLESFREPATHKRTVLVVDDEPTVLHLTGGMLEDLGCHVVTATDGNEALDKLKDDPGIAILITDINMPGLSGYELVERARRMRPDLQVILLSGRETDGHGLPLIRKPFLEDDLIRVMRQTTGLC